MQQNPTESRLKDVLAKIDRLDPKWRLAQNEDMLSSPKLSFRQQAEDGVLECRIDIVRASFYERSEVIVQNYFNGLLDEKDRIGPYYKELVVVFRMVEQINFERVEEGLFRDSGWKRPKYIPKDHELLMEYADRIAKPLREKFEVQDKNVEELNQKNARQAHDNFFNT
jgi:hypothetical protein